MGATVSNPVVGRRRIDRILDPQFVSEVAALGSEDLLERRDQALQEESDVSYVRRLIQGRLDLLKFEKDRRAQSAVPQQGPVDDSALVEALTSVLADRPRSGGRVVDAPGLRAVPLRAPAPEHSVYSRRAAESAVADVRFSDLRSLGDAELEEAIGKFTELERDVSSTRSSVQKVADMLAAEVESRVAAGTLRPELM